MSKHRILFVCLGNICRSPCAEGIFTHQLQEKQLLSDFTLDSAGTSAAHQGQQPDLRMIRACQKRDYSIENLRSRPIDIADFYEFDHIFAMDRHNEADLKKQMPSNSTAKIARILTLIPQSTAAKRLDFDVPDPYYTASDEGFYLVMDLLENACEALIKKLT